MKRTLVLIVACICISPAWSASRNTQPMAQHIKTLADAFACTVMAGTPGVNKAPQCRDSDDPAPVNAREFDKAANKKTLRECMKPDNLIDDDVRKCMKGL